MPIPGLGHRSYLQIGPKETTYGTFQTPTKKLELISWNIAPDIGVINDPSLYNQQSQRALYQGPLLYRGTFVVRANYEGILLELLRGVTGTYTSAVVDTSARDHFFKEGPTLNSYSFEVILGDVPSGTSKCWRLLGAKVLNLSYKIKAAKGDGGMGTIEFTVLAKDMISGQTPTGALSFPANFPPLFHQCITADDGTADAVGSVRVRGLEVTLENPHADDRLYLGSLNIDEPLRNGFLKARYKLEQEFITATQWDAARAFTVGSPQFIFQHPTLVGATTAKREFEFRSNQANLTEFTAPISDYGIMVSTATWEAFFDPTDVSAIVVRVRNADVALP